MFKQEICKIGFALFFVLLLASPASASEGEGGAQAPENAPIITIDFQGIIDGIVSGTASNINKALTKLPSMLWDFFYETLLLKPLGLDDPESYSDIVSATRFFLSSQPNVEPFRESIKGLAELLIVFLALGIILVSVKAYWEILNSDDAKPIEAILKRDVLPIFIGGFALSLTVELYQLILYISRLMLELFSANIDQLLFRDFMMTVISPDLLGLLGITLILLFSLFLVFTYVLELVNAFLFPIFITLRVLPFDVSKAFGQSGLYFSVMNAFMPFFSAIMIFIATSVWGSPTFWESLSMDGFTLFLTKRLLGLVFLFLSIIIPVVFYLNAILVPILRMVIGMRILRAVR